jgi:hypothetical protein
MTNIISEISKTALVFLIAFLFVSMIITQITELKGLGLIKLSGIYIGISFIVFIFEIKIYDIDDENGLALNAILSQLWPLLLLSKILKSWEDGKNEEKKREIISNYNQIEKLKERNSLLEKEVY